MIILLIINYKFDTMKTSSSYYSFVLLYYARQDKNWEENLAVPKLVADLIVQQVTRVVTGSCQDKSRDF